MAQDTTIIMVGVIILIAILVAPMLFGQPTIFHELIQGARDLFQDFRDAFFEDWGDSKNSSMTLGFGVVVQFKDGTTKQIKTQSYSIFPLSIYLDGKEIESLNLTAQAKIKWNGELTSLNANGKFTAFTSWDADRLNMDYWGYLPEQEYDKTLDIPEEDTWFIIETRILTPAQIEPYLTQGTGKYVLWNNVFLELNASFEDGVIDTESDSAQANLIIDYKETGINGLELEIDPNPS